MDFFSTLFGTPGIASSLLYVCLAAFTGILLGKLQILDVKLGVAGVLFSGILIGHFGAVLDHDILRFVSDFGLILFVYSFGLEMGPRFFSSFKRDGLTLNLFAIGIALGGVGVAYAIYALTDLSPAVVMGILCGGVTNTTSLGAAQQVLMDQGGDFTSSVAQSSMGYALTYPFGVVGLILAMILLRKLFRVDLKEEAKAYSDHLDATETKLQSVEITVSNQNLVGKAIGELRDILDAELAVSRIYRNHDYVLATDDQTIVEGDVIYGVSEQKHIDDLRLKIGDVVIAERQNITGMMDICNVLLTNKHLAGNTIALSSGCTWLNKSENSCLSLGFRPNKR
jgi:putative transport protein